MKKSYISPSLRITQIQTARLIADSLRMGTTAIDDEGAVLIKGESSSPSRYNVWDDDWSN